MQKMDYSNEAMTAVTAAAGSSKTLIAAGGAKLLSFAGVGLALASVVVMAMTNPTSRKELIVALICTLVSSLCGGAAFVTYFQLQSWASEVFGLMGIMGIAFACGLPGWVLVRSCFVFSEKNSDKGIDFFIGAAKGLIKKA